MKKEAVFRGRTLRGRTTKAEDVFWYKVRNRRFLNLKFLRQCPISFKIDKKDRFYVADFFCASKKTIIEIDGKIHDDQKERDKLREQVCGRLGYKTIRLRNEDVIYRTEKTLKKLEELI